MQYYSLNKDWELFPKNIEKINKFTSFFNENPTVKFNIPYDIHSSLIDNNIIEDPYFKTNEIDIQWVGQNDWIIQRNFFLNKEIEYKNAYLKLSNIDTVATLHINGKKVFSFDNQFIANTINIKKYLKKGDNTITFTFYSAEKEAIKRAKSLSYPIPYTKYPITSPNRNLVRKTQCHGGWDWGPCIMAFGIYDDLNILFTNEGYITYTKVNTTFREESWNLDLEIEYFSESKQLLDLNININNQTLREAVEIKKGHNLLKKTISCKGVESWYPNNEGSQTLYPLEIKIGEFEKTLNIGFREIKVKTKDNGLTFTVNGREVFMKGTNWIPQDSLPGRYSLERYNKLLDDCIAVNMNMIRVWGGGLYEKEEFYELCDKKGLLVWQDCMFACSLYPSNDEFLNSVKDEVTYQVRRLQYHPSIALWCGNNEDLGAISWYEESRKNSARYLVDYDRLNEGVVAKVIKKEDPKRIWWPSSPSAGPGDYSDNWHNDSKGDMHFWSVWHEGKDFEEYYKIRPRFVSEFGYQSFPSISTIESFADEDDLNITSEVMEHHQKNDRGNTIILENFTRYYIFPTSFDQQIYLSQVQQAKAMKMAIEYFRSLKNYCMGALYWQLNDCWPVASWSSIDYLGKWKAMHYEAKRFFNPLLLTFINKDGKTEVHFVNDTQKDLSGLLLLETYDFNGNLIKKIEEVKTVKANSAQKFETLSFSSKEKQNSFIVGKYITKENEISAASLLTIEKKAHLKDPKINLDITKKGKNIEVTIKTEKPAFNVYFDTSFKGNFTDNNMFIFKDKTVEFINEENIEIEEFKKSIKVLSLYSLGK